MADRSRRTRAGRARLLGRQRASVIAVRLGIALRAARLTAGLTQVQLGAVAGLSQGWISEAERGLGATGSLETWASLAAGVGLQLAAFFELAPGASPPRDLEHVRRQQAIINLAVIGGWSARPESPITTGEGVQRFVDVLLERSSTDETLVVEIVDLLADVGNDLRGLERKVAAVQIARPGRRVAGLLVLRATVRNRGLVREFSSFFGSRCTSGAGWMRALSGEAPLPAGDGLIWSGATTSSLWPARLPKLPGGRP